MARRLFPAPGGRGVGLPPNKQTSLAGVGIQDGQEDSGDSSLTERSGSEKAPCPDVLRSL